MRNRFNRLAQLVGTYVIAHYAFKAADSLVHEWNRQRPVRQAYRNDEVTAAEFWDIVMKNDPRSNHPSSN